MKPLSKSLPDLMQAFQMQSKHYCSNPSYPVVIQAFQIYPKPILLLLGYPHISQAFSPLAKTARFNPSLPFPPRRLEQIRDQQSHLVDEHDAGLAQVRRSAPPGVLRGPLRQPPRGDEADPGVPGPGGVREQLRLHDAAPGRHLQAAEEAPELRPLHAQDEGAGGPLQGHGRPRRQGGPGRRGRQARAEEPELHESRDCAEEDAQMMIDGAVRLEGNVKVTEKGGLEEEGIRGLGNLGIRRV